MFVLPAIVCVFCRIETVPNSLFLNLTDLMYLDLSDNRLGRYTCVKHLDKISTITHNEFVDTCIAIECILTTFLCKILFFRYSFSFETIVV